MRTSGVASRAEAKVVEQLVDAFEAVRTSKGLRVADVAKRSHLSKRMVCKVRKLQTRPSLGALIALADAHDLELDIRVRTKRPKLVEHPQLRDTRAILTATNESEGQPDAR